MIDHIGVKVSQYPRSRDFYVKALAPLHYELMMEFPANGQGAPDVGGFGEKPHPDLWLAVGPVSSPVHVAIRVKSRRQVDAFHKAALAAGGRNNGGPGLRPQYHPNYYAAFVLDPDGHNVEAVCHHPE